MLYLELSNREHKSAVQLTFLNLCLLCLGFNELTELSLVAVRKFTSVELRSI